MMLRPQPEYDADLHPMGDLLKDADDWWQFNSSWWAHIAGRWWRMTRTWHG